VGKKQSILGDYNANRFFSYDLSEMKDQMRNR